MKAKVKDRGGVSPWEPPGYSDDVRSSSLPPSPLTGTRQTLFRLNNGFSVISGNDMVRR